MLYRIIAGVSGPNSFLRGGRPAAGGEGVCDPLPSRTVPPRFGQPTHPTRGVRFSGRRKNLRTETTWRTSELLFPEGGCMNVFEYLNTTDVGNWKLARKKYPAVVT